MTQYVAFLRGINVGGHKPVKMEALRSEFERLKLRQVATFKASGNVLFETEATDPERIRSALAGALEKRLGGPVGVFLRSRAEIIRIREADPFPPALPARTAAYVTFLAGPPAKRPKLPLLSPHGNVRLLTHRDGAVFSLGEHTDRGPGFPNELVESVFGVPATTRNWNTLLGVDARFSSL
jgi:uncharacterized protein (DUF1697 family)